MTHEKSRDDFVLTDAQVREVNDGHALRENRYLSALTWVNALRPSRACGNGRADLRWRER